MDEIFGEIIASYTRAEMIQDGDLVDVTPRAREAGFRYPVALTRAVWKKYVEVPPGVRCQDEEGRLWDILWMASIAARMTSGPVMQFPVFVRNDNRRAKQVTLKSICGPGDTIEPVITILLPSED